MQRAGETSGVVGPTSGGVPQPEKKKSFWETILRLIGISAPKSTQEDVKKGRGPFLHVSSPPQGLPVEQVANTVQLAELALEMRTSGAALERSKEGAWVTKTRSRSFSRIPWFPNMQSSSRAETFLSELAFAAESENIEVKTNAQKALESFADSKWFKRVLKKYPHVGQKLVETALKVFGPTVTQQNRVQWGMIQEALKGCGLEGNEDRVNGWIKAFDAKNPQRFPPLAFLPQTGMPLTIDGNTFWVESTKARWGAQAVRFTTEKDGKDTEIGQVTVDRQGYSVHVVDQGKQQLAPRSSLLKDCMKAFEQKLDKMAAIYMELRKQGVEENAAKKIVERWSVQWRGDFVEEPDKERGILRPTRLMKGLKIGGKEGERYGDYSFTILGSGSEKKAKKIVRITAEGDIEPGVRYGKVAKKEDFFKSMRREWEVRQDLLKEGEKIPLPPELDNYYLFDNILKLEKYVSHVGKSGEVTRYVGEEGSGDLFKRMYREVEDYYELLPEGQRAARPLLVHACLGALRGLRHLHVRGFVNKDVKPDNVLLINGEGKLADFGLTTRVSEGAVPCGTAGRIAPELIQKHYHSEVDVKEDPKTDMFSFGVMLLEAWDGDLGDELVVSLVDASSYSEYCIAINSMQQKLRKKIMGLKAQGEPTQPLELIFCLIDPNPDKRPDSTEAERVLQEVDESLRRMKQ